MADRLIEIFDYEHLTALFGSGDENIHMVEKAFLISGR